jgi:hypothetical protein
MIHHHPFYLRVVTIFFLSLSALLGCACHQTGLSESNSSASTKGTEASAKKSGESNHGTGSYSPPVRLAQLENPAIKESSGLVASRRNENVFWTHNDSGDGPFIYAFNRQGKSLGVWRVEGATAQDWEGIASAAHEGQDYLYVGDIGDNQGARSQIVVYRFKEPHISAAAASSTKNKPMHTEEAEALRFRYPDGKHDAEALLVHPNTGDLYVVTKTALGVPTFVYKASAPLSTGGTITFSRLAEINVPSVFGSMITGGDISPDGRRVVLCNYLRAYELELPSGESKGFDAIWQQEFTTVELGPREQGEAVCYRSDGRAILATSEQRYSPLIEVQRIGK